MMWEACAAKVAALGGRIEMGRSVEALSFAAASGLWTVTSRSAADTVRVVTPMSSHLMSALHQEGAQVTVDADGAIVISGMTSAEVGELAAHRSVTVHELVPVRASLEDAFMELTRDSVEFRAKEAS